MNRRSFIGLLGALGIVPLTKIPEAEGKSPFDIIGGVVEPVGDGGFLVPIPKADELDTAIRESQPACSLYARRTYYNPGETWQEIGTIHEMTMPREDHGRELPGFGFGPDNIHITLLACLEPSMMLHHKDMLDFRVIKRNAWTWQSKQRWDFQGHISEYNAYYAPEEGGGVDLVIKPNGPVEWSIEIKEGE